MEESKGLKRIPLRALAERMYRPADEGIREWDPRPKASGPIVVTRRVSPSIRSAVGWLYPLESYDPSLDHDPLSGYAERLLRMGSREAMDFGSLRALLREARDRLTEAEYERLLGYADLLLIGRVGIPPEIK